MTGCAPAAPRRGRLAGITFIPPAAGLLALVLAFTGPAHAAGRRYT